MCTSPSREPANRIAVSVVPMPSRSGASSTCRWIADVALDGGRVQLAQQVVARVVVVERGQRGDHQRRGDLTRGVAAHAVGQRQQPRPGVDRVLVVLPDEAAVASRGVPQDEGHERSSITVLPMRTGTPRGTRVGPVTLALSR